MSSENLDTLDPATFGRNVAAAINTQGSQGTRSTFTGLPRGRRSAPDVATSNASKSPMLLKAVMVQPNFQSDLQPCRQWLSALEYHQPSLQKFVYAHLTVEQVVAEARSTWPFLGTVEVTVLNARQTGKSNEHVPMPSIHPSTWSVHTIGSFPGYIVIRPNDRIQHNILQVPPAFLCFRCMVGGIVEVPSMTPGPNLQLRSSSASLPSTPNPMSLPLCQNLLRTQWLPYLQCSLPLDNLLNIVQGSQTFSDFVPVLNASDGYFKGHKLITVDRSVDVKEFLNYFRVDVYAQNDVKPENNLSLRFRGEEATGMDREKFGGLLHRVQTQVLTGTTYKLLEGQDGRLLFCPVPNRRAALKFRQAVVLWIRTFLKGGTGIAGIHPAHKQFIMGSEYQRVLDFSIDDIADEDVADLFNELNNDVPTIDFPTYFRRYRELFGEDTCAENLLEAKEDLLETHFIKRVEPELKWIRQAFRVNYITAICGALVGADRLLFPKALLVTLQMVKEMFRYPGDKMKTLADNTLATAKVAMNTIVDSFTEEDAQPLLYALTGDTSIVPGKSVVIQWEPSGTNLYISPMYVYQCLHTVNLNPRSSIADMTTVMLELVKRPTGSEFF